MVYHISICSGKKEFIHTVMDWVTVYYHQHFEECSGSFIGYDLESSTFH